MALVCSASVSVAAECAVDPNECTLKKLCEVATTVDGNNTTWSTATGSAKHVTLSQSLGIECGVTPIVDLCDTNPSECKVSQICGKATTDNAGQKSWNDSAAAYVAKAKEYGLICDVSEEAVAQEIAEEKVTACSFQELAVCTDAYVCTYATNQGGGPKVWSSSNKGPVKEAKKRGITCGVVAIIDPCGLDPNECRINQLCKKATKSNNGQTVWNSAAQSYVDVAKEYELTCGVEAKTCSTETSEACTTEQLCMKSTYKAGGLNYWITSATNAYKREAKKRGLACSVTKPRDLPLCPTSGYRNNCFGSWTSDEGNKWIGTWKSNEINGVATIYYAERHVSIFTRRNDKDEGPWVYIWPTGQARFEWEEMKSFSSNSTVNAVFPSLTRMFNNLPKHKRIAIQNSLTNKGLYSSSIDGAWGRNTLIGIARFTAEHVNSINLKSSENIEIVLAAMVEQGPLKRTKVAKPTIFDAVAKRGNAATNHVSNSFNFKGEYTSQSLLRRKQIQYALKKLGFYSSSVDGLWGDGTSSAIVDYAQSNGVGGNSPSSVFSSILSKVDVPSSFAAPKRKVTTTTARKESNGLTAIVSNPSMAAAQAYAICEPKARMMAQSSADGARPMGMRCNTTNDYFGRNTRCRERSKGSWPGLIPLLLETDPNSVAKRAGDKTFNLAMDSCLAQYGWRD